MVALTTAANIAFAGIAQYGKMGTIAKAGAKAEQAGLTEVTSEAIEIAKNRVKNFELAGKAAKHAGSRPSVRATSRENRRRRPCGP